MGGPSAQLRFRLVSEQAPRGPTPVAFSTQANTTREKGNAGGASSSPTATGAGSKASWSRLLPLVRPEIPMLAAGGAALLLSSAITMAIPIGFGRMIDIAANSMEAIGSASDGVLGGHSLLIGGVFVVGACSSVLKTYAIGVSQARLIARLRKRLYSSLLERPIQFYDANRSGDLVNVLSSDVNAISAALGGNTIADGLRHGVQLCGSLGIMLYLSPKLTSVMLAIAPAIAVTGLFYGKFVRAASNKVQRALGESTALAEERMSDIRSVKAFVRSDWEQSRYASCVNEVLNLSKRVVSAESLFSGSSSLVGNLSMLALLGYGSHLVVSAQITAGTLTSFMFYSVYLGISIVSLSRVFGQVMSGLGAGQRVLQFLPEEKEHVSHLLSPTEPLVGELEFRDVMFRYPTRPEVQVLKGFSLSLNPGECTAIVGQSGSGKSTLASLLLRFYEIESGSILIDGRDIVTLDPDWIRHHVGIVSQEPTLFSGSVMDNILYGNEKASFDDVRRCAKLANADQFIQRFPNGYDTLVGQHGVTVSGGQKQRIAIARTLLKDPAILVLDEATSALDAHSASLVEEALRRLMEKRTTLLIAHSPAAVKRAQSIAVLSEGAVVQQGSHEKLINEPDSIYRGIMERRFVGA